MCWMFAITVLPRCAKGACWWAKSTAAVWSHTPWVKSYSIPHCFHTAVHASRQKKQKHYLSLSCCFSSFFPLWSGAPGHSPAKASLCSWKNDLNDKLHTGLLRSGLFLAHLYKNPHSKKKKKEEIWEKHKLHPLHDAGTNTMSCCAYSPSQLAEQTPQSHLWEQATLLRRGNNNEY